MASTLRNEMGNSPSTNGSTDLSLYPAIQQDEFTVLRSIYLDDFEEIEGKSTAWTKLRNLAFQIHLKSSYDQEIAATLCFEWPKDYPKVLPLITLKSLQSRNPAVRAKFNKIISTKPPALRGHEMTYEICSDLQELLEDAAESRAGKLGLSSLEEERMAQESIAEREVEERNRAKQQQQELDDAEADLLLAEEVKTQRRRQIHDDARNRATQAEIDDGVKADLSTASHTFTFDQSIKGIDVAGERQFRFRQVSGNYILHYAKDKTVTVVTPEIPENLRVPPYLLKIIRLPEQASETDKLRLAWRKIEDLLTDLKQHSHDNVVEILGYKVERIESADAHDRNIVANWNLAILSPYATQGSLSDVLHAVHYLQTDDVRSCAQQLVSALQFLDQHNYVHPALHAGNVLFFISPSGHLQIKISDGYGQILRDMVMKARSASEKAGIESALWTAPELTQDRQARTNKTCIWELGVVVLQMAIGNTLTEQYTSPDNCMAGVDFSNAFTNFLTTLFAKAPESRPKAFDISSAPFMHDDTGPLRPDDSTDPETPLKRKQGNSVSAPTISRYRSEWWYQNETRLAAGGFGAVYKCQYRHDGQFYAVKKVRCSSEADLVNTLAEVKNISILKHHRIVRYYSSWTEPVETSSLKSHDRRDSDSTEAIAGTNDLVGIPSTGPDFFTTDPYNFDISSLSDVGIQHGVEVEDEDSGPMFAVQSPPRTEDSSSEENSAPPTKEENHEQALGPRTESRRIRFDNEYERKGFELSDRQTPPASEQSILYIQMELCEKATLRRPIAEGLTKDPANAWRLFRQILEAVAYIHGLGIYHRDLKPENIFIDDKDDIRVGDFGLATTGYVSSANRVTPKLKASEISQSVGTPLYIAPELTSAGSHLYDDKADMYSLGMVFFEMNFDMPTFMHRREQLLLLRESQHSLPDHFSKPEYKIQGEIIMQLLDHDQSKRPSANELLNGGRIPEPVAEEMAERYVNSLLEDDPGKLAKLRSLLFKVPITRAQDRMWEITNKNGVDMSNSMLSTHVNEKIKAVFHRHGAIASSRQMVFPKSEIYSDAASFIDKSGIVVQLPYDLTFPMARSLARKKPEYDKIYSFGRSYRQMTAVSDVEPLSVSEVAYDHVSYSARDLSLKDAEVLKVLDEIIQEFPSLSRRPLVIHINHGDLLDMILDHCEIKKESRRVVKRAVSAFNVNKRPWKQVREQLRSSDYNIASTALNDLEKFAFSESLDIARNKIEKVINQHADYYKLAQIFRRLEEMTDYLKLLKVATRLVVSPLRSHSEELHRGQLMFELVDEELGSILAAGGRYDELIAKLRDKTAKDVRRAVGFRLNALAIVAVLDENLKTQSSTKHAKTSTRELTSSDVPRRCDVVVTSPDSHIFETTCLQVAAELWSAGISAELSSEFRTAEELDSRYYDQPHCLAVLIRPDRSAIGELGFKIRNMQKREEIECEARTLVRKLRQMTQAVQFPSQSVEREIPKLRREISIGEGSHGTSSNRLPDVRFFVAKHKNKKVNRDHLVNASAASTRELLESFIAEDPVVAVDMNDDLIDLVRNTRLMDSASWKLVRDGAAVGESDYVKELQATLQGLAIDEKKKGAFIFSSKTKKSIYYDFGVV